MSPPWYLTALMAMFLATRGAAITPNHGDFQQASPEPQVSAGSPGSTSSLRVLWDTVADRAAPKILGYELQYAVAGRSGGSDDTIASWKSAEGNTHDTWDITIQVDGFDRSTGRKHMVEDGWFTLALSRAYPKPSSLPDLWLDTEPIGWDDTWVDMEAKVQRALRESRHPQYSSWMVAVVRCDETEERGGKHWAGGCRFLEYGGFTWHLRLSPPPGDASATREDFPVVTVTKETITAKWSGDGDQVVSERFGDHSQSGGDDSAHEEDLGRTNLIDPFYCQRGSCERMLEGLAAATPYLVRLRAYNRNGFGPWMSSTTDMSVGTTGGGAAGISTNTVPVTPAPKAPKLSSSTPTSLTVFVDTASTTGAAEIEAYEFEVQRQEDDGYRGDTTRWIPVSTHADDNSDAAVPLTTATELSPSSSYRFRVRARHSNGLSLLSGHTTPIATGLGLPTPSPLAPAVDVTSITSSTMAVKWSSWAPAGVEYSGFEAQWERLGSGYWQNASTITQDRGSQEEWRATAEGLEAYSQHRFRVRAVNAVGAGEWSAASDWARTEGDPSTTAGVDGFEAEAVDSDIPASVLLSVSGEGQTPGHAKDFDYYHGVGVGGKVSLDGQGGDGGPGAAVIVSRIPGVPLPSRSSFFFTGAPELYAVPSHSGVTSVTLKLWGAGGGGVLTPVAAAGAPGDNETSNATQVLGGGGGFLQAEVKVSPGEMLEVLVGGGGGGAPGEAGGAGGFNGGQPGGSGGSGAAGGGGSTSVLRRDGKRLVAAAGGGGGAGNAESCCSEGGAGGGVRGTDGGSPALDQMVVNTAGGGECQNGWCSAFEADAVSYEGIENWVTTGGSGGSTVQGGLGGKSDVFDWVDGGGGRQGAVSSPRSGESSMPIVFRGTGSRPATPGRSLTGGIGANGARGGGGGGGGFYGGGGGGSGQQGAGGGGGSSHADTGALALDHRTNEWGSGGEDGLRVVEVGESWVEVEWRTVVGAVAGEQPMFYEVEISEGSGNEDFRLSARVDAFDGYSPSAMSSYSRDIGDTSSVFLSAVLSGLSPSSDFDVRVVPISRLGTGTPSAVVRFSTSAFPVNEWERVIPRPSWPERHGRGLTGPELGRTDSWDTDLASMEAEGGGLSNPPTEMRQELPSPRSGHTMVVIGGKVYMFGGISAKPLCSSATVGSTALGDTAGGANTEDCMGGDSFSAELWEFNPSTSVWTEVLVNVDGDAPPARDGHTASVVGSKMVVFGGRGNGSDSDAQAGRGSNTALLEDEWAIDLDLSQLITISTNFSTNIREGSQIFIPLVVEQTEAQRAEADVDMCVTDLSVAVEIDHDCIQQLQLTLYGPGPPPGHTSRLGDVSRAEPAVLVLGGGISDCASDVDLFGDGNDGAAGDVSYGGCVDGMDVAFEDSAESGVWEGCNNRSPLRGTFKAADLLLVGRFLRMPAEGEWTLGVLDNAVDGSNGTVTRWSLDVEIRPCDWRSALRWINVSGDARPPARARHTAAVVDGGLFVSGGTGSFGALSDLWRRGEASSEWMILAEGPGVPLASTGPYNPHGASVMVSPWGMLSIGGMLPGRGVESASGVWVLDPVSKRWRPVNDDGGVDASSPVGRYSSSVAMVKTLPGSSTNDNTHGLLILFGGKDDWRRLDDLWRLNLRSVHVTTSTTASSSDGLQATPRPHTHGSWSLAELGRDARCAHALVAGTANDTWHSSCGDGANWGGRGEDGCTMAAVLEAAWCLGEYQSV
ncbi:unnamed protein product [Ectocarpus sp. 6 AP-2014]